MRIKNVYSVLSGVIQFDAAERMRSAWRQIPTNYRYALAFGVAFSFLANGLQFINIILTEDGLVFWHQSPSSLWRSGRWMIDVYRSLQEGFSFPIVSGVVSSLSLSLAACVNGSIWKTRRLLPLFLMTAVYTSYPAFADGYFYQFMATAWPLSCLFAVLAVYFVRRADTIGFFLGVGSLVISMAFYQSLIGLTAGLCVVTMIFDLLDEAQDKRRARAVSLFALRCLALGVVACAVYLISVRACKMAHPGVEMYMYKGMERMGQMPVAKLAFLTLRAYRGFAAVFSGLYFLLPLYLRITLWSMPLMLVLCLVKMALDLKPPQRPTLARWLLIATLLALWPPVMFVVSFLAPDSGLTSLHSFGVVALLSAAVYAGGERLNGLPRSLVLVLAAGMLLGFVNRSNAMGLKAHLYTQASFSTAHRVLARLETLPEFQQGDKSSVVFVGNLPNETLRAADKPPFTERNRDLRDAPPGFGQYPSLNKALSNLYAMMNIDMPCSDAHLVRAELLALDMPAWPAAESVKAFDNLIVVNFGRDLFVEIKSAGPDVIHATAHVPHEPDLWQYAWKVRRGSEVIHQSAPGKSASLDFTCKTSGRYSIECEARRRKRVVKHTSGYITVTVPR